MCHSVDPNFGKSKVMLLRSKDPDVLTKGKVCRSFLFVCLFFLNLSHYNKPSVLVVFLVQTEMAAFGQDLMLCKADDLDLIRVRTCVMLF